MTICQQTFVEQVVGAKKKHGIRESGKREKYINIICTNRRAERERERERAPDEVTKRDDPLDLLAHSGNSVCRITGSQSLINVSPFTVQNFEFEGKINKIEKCRKVES